MSKLTIAIAGATGAVGQQMLQCLEERKIDCELRLFASYRSAGKTFSFQGKEIVVEELKEESFENIDIVLGATENDITAFSFISDGRKLYLARTKNLCNRTVCNGRPIK